MLDLVYIYYMHSITLFLHLSIGQTKNFADCLFVETVRFFAAAAERPQIRQGACPIMDWKIMGYTEGEKPICH